MRHAWLWSVCGAHRRWLWLLPVLVLFAAGLAWSADWPTYQHDTERSGVTTETLPPVLTECWEFRSRHAPAPAWEPPRSVPVENILELPRVRFDDAYHVAAAGDALYFGSSADNKVYCLDASTGQTRWTFFTGGPVRLAPTVCDGRVYFGSDDGFVYCLGASDGKVIWQRRVGPDGRKLLGHGKMISMWPIRTGVLVDEGIAYFGAGVFPAEGVYIEAVRADNGELVWRNDTGGEATESRISPQGYLLATPEVLYTPMGRTTPTAYDRANGRLLQSPSFGKTIGGFSATIVDGMLCTGTEEVLAYNGLTKAKIAWFQGRKIIVAKDAVYMVTDKEMIAVGRGEYSKESLRQFTSRDQKQKLASTLALAKKDKKAATDDIVRQQKALEETDQRLGDLSQEKRASLDAERATVVRAMQAARDKVAAADRKIAQVQEQQVRIAEDWADAGVKMESCVLWRLPCACPNALIRAGSTLFAGGQDEVIAVDAETGQKLWNADVRGKARGLAVANGRLFVSTDTGTIHAFGSGDTPPRTPRGDAGGVVSEPGNPAPYPEDPLTPMYEAAAERIVRESGVRRGYCLVLGGETGRLALELAKRTELRIYAIEPDAQKVAVARKALDEAGLYGTRVCMDEGPLDSLPYSDYFANLVVSDRVLVSGPEGCSAEEMFRVLRPLGGVALLGRPEMAGENSLDPAALKQWLAQGGVSGTVVNRDGVWANVVRPALPDAGRWTHEYANAGNTACGDDRRLKCPLGLLWFGDPGPLQMLSRHVRQAGPLSVNGVLFVQGENAVMAYDAYNGLKLWERAIPKVVRVAVSQDVSNLAADDNSFYVAVQDRCLRLDAATGNVKATYLIPKCADGAPRQWGYVAVDKGMLFGSGALSVLAPAPAGAPAAVPAAPGQDGHVAAAQLRTQKGRTCDTVFAYDVSSGRLRWKYSGKAILHSSISIGDGKVFLADQTVAPDQKGKAPDAKTGNVRLVVALSASTGKVAWQKPMDLTGCTGGSYWGTLATMYRDGVLVLFGVYTDGHFWKDFFANQFGSRRIVVVSARDGSPMWARNIGYRVRPLIIGDTLHAEPWAFNLRTGEPVERVNPITGQKELWQFARPGHHCGCPVANPNCLFFRSYHIGYYDLIGDFGTEHFGGQRPGCWVNFIAANGLLLVPEASSGCMCPFPNQCTVVFEPRREDRGWGKYSLSGPTLPVKRLALNLGAPGDRKDDSGALWLAFPRPTGSLVLSLKADAVMLPKGEYFKYSPDYMTINGTPNPWLYTFGARGLKQLAIPLLGQEDDPASYTVRLGFAELEDIKPKQRVFSVLLQGKPVLKDFDVVKEAGEPRKVVMIECTGVEVSSKLTIDLASKKADPSPEQMPILQTVEIIREKMTGFRLAALSFTLSTAAPEQEAEVRISNYTDGDFEGALVTEAPDGFSLTPDKADVKVASGSRTKLTVHAAAVKKLPPGRYPVVLKLTGSDGKVECEARSEIDYLGDRSRVVFKPVEAATIGPNSPSPGSDKMLFVDGGNKEIGDQAYSLALLKFKIDLPASPASQRGESAKPVSVKLRIWNAGNPSSNGGDICQVTTPWGAETVTYEDRPQLGPVLANLGPVAGSQMLEVSLPLRPGPGREGALSLEGLKELSLAIVPVNSDGVNYVSIKGETPPELEIECER